MAQIFSRYYDGVTNHKTCNSIRISTLHHYFPSSLILNSHTLALRAAHSLPTQTTHW